MVFAEEPARLQCANTLVIEFVSFFANRLMDAKTADPSKSSGRVDRQKRIRTNRDTHRRFDQQADDFVAELVGQRLFS